MISITTLSYQYRHSSTAALSDVSLDIESKASTALLGPNGAGKTTLVSLITGQLAMQQGQILIDGLDVKTHRRDIQQFLSVVPQDYAFYTQLSGMENLDFFAGMLSLNGSLKSSRIATAIEMSGLQNAIHQPANEYSGGLKRRLNLAIGLLNDPKLLILDEPTVGIDPQSRQHIIKQLNTLQEQGTTLVYTSHILDEVQRLCDQLTVIDHGQILLNGGMHEILANEKTLHINLSLRDAPTEQQLALLKPDKIINNGQGQEELQWDCNIENANDKTTHLLILLQQQQLNVQSLSLGNHRLEDLFLSLTDTELRD